MGKSQSGKTTAAVNIVNYLIPSVDHVIVCSPTYQLQHTWDSVRPYVSLHVDNLSNLTKVLLKYVNNLEGKPFLLVLDDVSSERVLNEGGVGPLNHLAYNAVWMNCSIVTICHRVTNIGGGLRENVEHLLIFRTINDKQEKALAENYSITGNPKDFRHLFRTIVTEPAFKGNNYAFLYICFVNGTKAYEGFTTQLNFTGQ